MHKTFCHCGGAGTFKGGSNKGTVARRIFSDGGFTIVEVLAAVALLSVGLLAVLAGTEGARDAQARAVCIATGRSIAQSEIEQARETPFDQIGSLAGASSSSSLPPGNTITVAVSNYPSSSTPDMRNVTVTVVWPEKNGTRTISYGTLIARK